MRQLIWILTLGIASPALFAQDSDIVGTMSCKVRAQTVINIEEGKANEYSGYEDSYDTGDTIRLTYGIANPDNLPEFTFAYSYRGENAANILLTDIQLSPNSTNVEKSSINESLRISSSDHKTVVHWGLDSITVDGFWGEASLKRYYKDDWQGLHISSFDFTAHTLATDCRHITNKVEEVWDYLNDQTD